MAENFVAGGCPVTGGQTVGRFGLEVIRPPHPGDNALVRQWVTDFAEAAVVNTEVDPADILGLPEELIVDKVTRYGFAAALGKLSARYLYYGDGSGLDSLNNRHRRSPARLIDFCEAGESELTDEVIAGMNNPWTLFQHNHNPYFRLGLSARTTYIAARARMLGSDDAQTAKALAARYDERTLVDPSRHDTKKPIFSAELLRGGELGGEVGSYLRRVMLAMAKKPGDYPTRRSRFEVAEQALLRHLDSRGSRHVVNLRIEALRLINDDEIRGIKVKKWTDADGLERAQPTLDVGSQPTAILEGVDPSPFTIGCMMRLVKARGHDEYTVFDNSALAVLRVAYEWPEKIRADLFDFDVAKAASQYRKSVPVEFRAS